MNYFACWKVIKSHDNDATPVAHQTSTSSEMSSSYFVFVLISLGHANDANLYYDRFRLFNPQNYLHQLPSLSLPYVDRVPIPSPVPALIKPSPVITTKVISVVTKYVTKSPMCVKVSGSKPKCQRYRNKNKKTPNKDGFEYLVTKEYFVEDPQDYNTSDEDYEQRTVEEEATEDEEDSYVEASENSRAFVKAKPTPFLNPSIRHILIEDRLDHLQEILPYYTRRKTFETSTITVTKVRNANKVRATLLVKNCVPAGIDVCPPKKKRRKSKVANFDNSTAEINDFFG